MMGGALLPFSASLEAKMASKVGRIDKDGMTTDLRFIDVNKLNGRELKLVGRSSVRICADADV